MVELKHSDTLRFTFPKVHKDAFLDIRFIRTLRVPDDGRVNKLPPGFDSFQMEHVADHARQVPANWKKHGGVMMPMYQSEAMWMSFNSPSDYPFAVKVACGKCCALTGNAWEDGLIQGQRRTADDEINLQNYLVVPKQPWLDGFNTGKNEVRQFVAEPLGEGITVEEQLMGHAEFGGIQIQVFPLDPDIWEMMKKRELEEECILCCKQKLYAPMIGCAEMGLGAGGRIRQEIYKDKRPLDEWDLEDTSRVFVHLMNAKQWTEVTGQPIPHEPFDTETYNRAGFPWFDYYADTPTIGAGEKLTKIKSIAEWDPSLMGRDIADPTMIVKYKKPKK